MSRYDHGPQYTSGDCDALCATWGVDRTFAPVGRPTGNAVAERVIRTMKEEVVWSRDWDSIDELRAALDAWLVRYNTRRPHQSLAWLTPAEYVLAVAHEAVLPSGVDRPWASGTHAVARLATGLPATGLAGPDSHRLESNV